MSELVDVIEATKSLSVEDPALNENEEDDDDENEGEELGGADGTEKKKKKKKKKSNKKKKANASATTEESQNNSSTATEGNSISRPNVQQRYSYKYESITVIFRIHVTIISFTWRLHRLLC
jgi:hypothetical protein